MNLKVTSRGVADAQEVIKWCKNERRRLEPQRKASKNELMKLPKDKLVYFLQQTSDSLDAALVTLIQSMEIFS